MTSYTWPESGSGSGSGANTTLSNLDSPTAINEDLIFDSTSKRTISIADVNAATGSMDDYNFRIVAQSNPNAAVTAPSGTLSLLGGGSPAGPVANVLFGSYYNGPDGAGPGDYYYGEIGVFADIGGSFGLRVYEPDAVSSPGTGGSVGERPTEWWQLLPGVGGSLYKFGTVHMQDMLTDGTHGYGVPTFPHLTVFDGTPQAAAYNGDLIINTGKFVLPTHTPASAADTGTAGTITWDSSFIYVCTATDTWKRIAILTW